MITPSRLQFFFMMLLILGPSCSRTSEHKNNPTSPIIHNSMLPAGWYVQDKDELNNQLEDYLKTAQKLAAIGDANGAVEALLFANGVGKNNIQEREETIKLMKEVFAETRVPGFLTLENRYFGLEQTIGIDNWLTSLDEIILEYVGKNKLDIKPIRNILNKGIYTGENTGE